MILDFGLMSVLLIAAHLLRSQWLLLQRIYLPTPIIAGLLGLIGSDQVLGVIPFRREEAGELALSTYPATLVALLFATLFLGARESSTSYQAVLRRAGDTFFYNLASELGQYALALLLGMLLLAPLFPDLHPAFALLMPAGFAGGHGTVTAIGKVLQDQGWEDALTIGYTFATVGLVSAIVGGMLLINIATQRGWTRLVRSARELPESMRKGFVPEPSRQSIGQETVSSIALDPLAWHVSLVLAAFAVAYLAETLSRMIPGGFTLPLFALAMLAGAVLQKTLDIIGLGTFVDRRLMERIGSSVSDYLVAFGVASIQITIVIQYAIPITFMCGLGIGYSLAVFWLLGRRMFHNFWFERSLFVYGWNTGVVAMGIALLRVVDPRLRSKTLEDFGLAYVGMSFFTIALIVILPQMIIRGHIAGSAVGLTIACLVCILLSRRLIGWFPQPADQVREGEQKYVEPW